MTAGEGSLRQAINNANARPGADTITFSIGTGPQTISPESTLPSIFEAVTIDATTQPGFAGKPIIELNLSLAAVSIDGLDIATNNVVLRGFVINHIVTEFLVCYVIHVRNGGQNIIEGNYVGTDPSGTIQNSGLAASGIRVESSSNTIGGTTLAARNLLAGHTTLSISRFLPATPADNRVRGNFIGTDASGTQILNDGFFFANYYGVDVLNSPNNIIGGTTAVRAILFPDAPSAGINVASAGSTGNLIQGNLIGTNPSGSAAVRNGEGVKITDGSSSSTVGGSTVAARNLISGSDFSSVGIGTFDASTTANHIVQGNYIGTDITGTVPIPNGISVGVPGNALGSQINANRIAFNGSTGVQIDEPSGSNTPGTRIAIFENEIFGNSGLGIDLGPLGITPNDPGDADVGANFRQNFPVLTAFSSAAPPEGPTALGSRLPNLPASLTITGSLNSTPNTTFTVHWYFSGDPQCFNSQQGTHPLDQGRVPNVTTDGNGNANFSFMFNFPPGVSFGVINSTATDQQGNTSEFSSCLPISDGTALIQFNSATYTVNEGAGTATIGVTRTAGTGRNGYSPLCNQ